MVLRSTIIGSGVAIAALLSSTNCNAFTPQNYHQYRTSSITTQSTKKTKLYQGFKEYPNEFDHPKNEGSSSGGPSPEMLKKMGVSDGQLPTPTSSTQPPLQQPPPVAATQQQPPQQFYDANGNPINTPPMVYDANGNLVPFTAPPQPMQQQPIQQATQPMQPQAQPIQAQQGTGQSQIQFEPNVPNALEPPLPSKSKNTDSPRPVGKFIL